jgi:hypothetical protein
MNKTQFLAGTIVGFAGTFIGCYFYLSLFTEYDFKEGIAILKSQGSIGKLITLGSIINLVIFGVLLKLDKEMMARGVVLSVIAMAILTLFL